MKVNRKSTTLCEDSDKMKDSPHNLDKKIIQAYKEAEYWLTVQSILVKIGLENKNLHHFLVDNKFFSYAFITAHNPFSKIQKNAVNAAAHKSLENKLKGMDLTYLLAKAKDPKNEWPEEEGFFVFDMPLEELKKLAMSFKQNAVVYGNITIAPQLIAL